MSFFLPPEEDVTIYETVFDGDLLGRVRISERLSKTLEKIEDPLVIALDGRWGTGKSYFLKRWVGAHRKQNNGTALTLYFDAFAHDYLSDPLIALVGSLSNRIPAEDQGKIDQIKSAALKFIKPAARIGIAMATFGASEALDDIGDAVLDAVGGEAKNAIDEFWKREEGRQAAMDEFHKAIKNLTESGEGNPATPLIIVIDELDRCRPDYALEVLEVIKHFFAVPHVHFVLGVNLETLENSVKLRYGSGVDSTAYLQKFLSFTMKLPDHIGDPNRTNSTIEYVNYLGRTMETPHSLLEEIRNQLVMISKNNQISIRDVGKIMSAASLLQDDKKGEELLAGWRMAMVTLIISRVIQPNLFQKLVSVSISEEELVKYLGATAEYTQEFLSHKKVNPKYDHHLNVLFIIWTYIRRNGELTEAEPGFNVAKLFDRFGSRGNAKKIPRKIYEDWLSDFNLT